MNHTSLDFSLTLLYHDFDDLQQKIFTGAVKGEVGGGLRLLRSPRIAFHVGQSVNQTLFEASSFRVCF